MGLFTRMLDAVRGREERDVFNADDTNDFDEDEAPSRFGPKLALIASGVIFLLLGGLGAAIYIVGKDATPEMVMAPLPKLTVEDVSDASPDASAPQPQTAPDAVAETDHSNQRRPWLNAPPAPTAKSDKTAPAPAPAMTPPPATTPAMTPPAPALTPPPAQTAKAAPAEPAPPSPPAPATTPSSKTAPSKEVAKAEAPATAPPPVEMPSVLAEGAAGVPERFTETGALNAGGRPRLVEPPSPPIDRKALGAPPPRYAGVPDMKTRVIAYTKAAEKNAADKGKAGKIAVVVRDLGLSQAATEAAITKLPAAVTLSFSPYASNAKKWVEMAKANGHEVLVEVPMESKQYPAEDPGPLGLMTSLDAKKNGERIDTILKNVPGAIGVDDSMGSKFRESESAMSTLVTKLKEKNLIYVQTEPGVRIGEPGVPNAAADVIIDERPFRAAIDARLDYVERLAKFQGSAVTVMSPKPVSFERLALWLETLNQKGVTLAPVSEVLVR